MVETKPLNLRTTTYNKLLSLKSGECTTFSKVVEKLISENKRLENENVKLRKENEEYLKELITLKKKKV